MLVVAIGTALTALGGSSMVFADDGDGGDATPAAEVQAPAPDTTIDEVQANDEMVPKEPVIDAMAAISDSLASLLSECRPGTTLVSLTPLVNLMDPGASTLIVATRGESDSVMDEPLPDLLASCTAAASDYTAAIMTGESDLFALMH